MQKKIQLFNPAKAARFYALKPLVNPEFNKWTPCLPLDRLYELRKFIGIKDKVNYSRVNDVIKRASKECGGAFLKPYIQEMFNNYPAFFAEEYWAKYKAIVNDENIEWEMIKKINQLPFLTEAYDLTVPPFCTFVLQNGIVVYDTVSFTPIYSKESRMEIEDLLKSKSYYITPNGDFSYSVKTDTLEYVIKSLTK